MVGGHLGPFLLLLGDLVHSTRVEGGSSVRRDRWAESSYPPEVPNNEGNICTLQHHPPIFCVSRNTPELEVI